jgi:hypothetical protein
MKTGVAAYLEPACRATRKYVNLSFSYQILTTFSKNLKNLGLLGLGLLVWWRGGDVRCVFARARPLSLSLFLSLFLSSSFSLSLSLSLFPLCAPFWVRRLGW